MKATREKRLRAAGFHPASAELFLKLTPQKRRAIDRGLQRPAERVAGLAMLARIARRKGSTALAAVRKAVRECAGSRQQATALRSLVWRLAPRLPRRFKTAAQLAKFKRAQREFDQMVLALKLATPEAVQARNSITGAKPFVRLSNFDRTHGNPA